MKINSPLFILRFSQWLVGVISSIGVIAALVIIICYKVLKPVCNLPPNSVVFFGGLIGTISGIISVLLIDEDKYYGGTVKLNKEHMDSLSECVTG